MRAFLIAFVCLSTLAMAQNVVVATPLAPAVEATSEVRPAEGASGLPTDARWTLLRREAPDPATMGLLVVGLSGLCAVGNRRSGSRSRQQTA